MKQRIYLGLMLLALVGAIAFCAVALPGCAHPATTPPTTQPTTQPAEQTAFDIANGVWQNLTAAAAIAEAVPGLIPPQDVTVLNLALAEGTKALATWQANLGQPAEVTLQAEFYAMLPDVAKIVADAKAKKAGTTVAAIQQAKAANK